MIQVLKTILRYILLFVKTYILWFAFLVILALILVPVLGALGFNGLQEQVLSFYSGTCHQLAHRSFFVWGFQLPVCSRCLGVYAGVVIAHEVSGFFSRYHIGYFISLGFLLLLERSLEVQLMLPYSRFFTVVMGFLGGLGFYLIVYRLHKVLDSSKSSC